MNITKYVLPVVVGSMSGMMLITFGERAIYLKYPLPADTDLYYAESVAKYLSVLPQQAFFLFLINYILCSVLAGVIATLVVGRVSVKPALIAGFALTLAGAYRALEFPVPVWFKIVSLLVYLPGAWAGFLIARKRDFANVPL